MQYQYHLKSDHNLATLPETFKTRDTTLSTRRGTEMCTRSESYPILITYNTISTLTGYNASVVILHTSTNSYAARSGPSHERCSV